MAFVSAQAGDILRGGAGSARAKRNAEARAESGADAANVARTTARDRLARTTAAISAVRAMQEGVQPTVTVPDGLVAGGLQRAAGVNARWTGALAPTQAGNTVNIQQTDARAVLHWEKFNVGRNTTLNFDQSAGKTDAGKWIAFNKVFDPSGQPSQILGSIKAQGQVYVINQNGIIFGAGSQVNTRTFVASSLPINDNLVESGLLNNGDAQFLFSGLAVPGVDGTSDFVPPVPPPGGKYGDVVVEAGAVIASEASADGNGGRVVLAGANVRNAGVISTPSGQTILAAGLQVGFQAHAQSDPSLRGLDVWVGAVGDYAGTVTNSGIIESQTGSIVAVGKEIQQLGVLDSSTSVTLNGRIDLLANYGAVGNPNFDRNAGSEQPPFLSQFTGVVRLGENSVTRVLPDLLDPGTTPGTSLPEVSQINIQGLSIYFGRGSITQALSGQVSIRAGTWPYSDRDGNRTSLDLAGADEAGLSLHVDGSSQQFLQAGGQVYFDSGSLLDVSGNADVLVPLSQYLMEVQLRGSELADSPLLRDSLVRGLALTVDLRRTGEYGGKEWVGTPLGDLTALAGIVERNIAQLTTKGGDITIEAGNSIVVQQGATLDVSGGYFTHEGGTRIQTTRLIRGRHLIDVAEATPDVLYDGVYEGTRTEASSKWGVTKTYQHALAPLGGYTQNSYVEGAAGGTIELIAPNLVLAGQLLGRTIKGPRQQDAPAKQGTLKLAFRGEKRIDTSVSNFTIIDQSPVAPDVRFVTGRPVVSAPAYALADARPGALAGPPAEGFAVGTDLFTDAGGGFGNLEIDNRDGDFVVPAGTKVHLPPGGSLSVRAKNVTVQDDIVAPGGTVSLTAYNFSPYLYQEMLATGALNNVPAPSPVAGRGVVAVESGATIDVAGMRIDERPTAQDAAVDGRVLDGGTVVLEGYTVRLAEGSRIDASGGVRATPHGKFEFGEGGDIFLLAGKDPDLDTIIGGRLLMGGVVQAYGESQGGALTIQANPIQIGGSSATPGALVLQPDFFRRGGFADYTLIGIGARSGKDYIPAIRVAAGTIIEPVSENLVVSPFGGRNGGIATSAMLKSAGLRTPTNLTLTGLGSDDPFVPNGGEDVIDALGLVVLEEGSLIRTDPGARVEISGELVAILGAVEAPGGEISVAGASAFKLPPTLAGAATSALPTLYLGPTARLSAAGTAVSVPDPYGRNSGILYPGGTVSLSGNIVAEAGAVLDVSGASAVLDYHPSRLASDGASPLSRTSGLNSTPWGRQGVPVRVDSDGGLIELHGSQMLYSDATLLGRAGGPTAVGGSLSISSGRFYATGADRTGADINLVVQQKGNALDFGAVRGIGEILGLMSGRADLNKVFAGRTASPGFFAIDAFSEGGFDSLDLGYKYFASASPIPYGGNLEFRGPVAINARGFVRLAGGGIIRATDPVAITAPYVAIGQEFRQPANPDDQIFPFTSIVNGQIAQHFVPPTHGAGSLTVSAELIDIGSLSLQGVGRALFAADGGDIRGNGSLNIAGDLVLRAAQIYPTTLANFDIFAYDHAGGPGSVSIIGSGVKAPPLSAGGSLRIFASRISQEGTLRAPLGSIVIGWDGTDADLTDPDIDQPLNPVVGNAANVPVARQVVLGAKSVTSVSAIDPASGEELLIPYGLSPDGTTWIDPRGVNVTVSGLPQKSISIAGESVVTAEVSVVDIRGGGDLFAYRWVAGTGGSADILGTAVNAWSSAAEYAAGDLVLFGGKTWSARAAIDPADFVNAPEPAASRYWTLVPESYAIVPGFGSSFAPVSPFNTGPNSGVLGGDPGFVSPGLKIGRQISLDASPGLAAGNYTLLPRRYALLPGAYLVIPQSSDPARTTTRADGSSTVSGYTFNALNRSEAQPALRNGFEIVPPDVLAARAEYEVYSANAFMTEAARRYDVGSVQRLPRDSGALSFHGNSALSLNGNVLARSVSGGRGASIDISSFADMHIIGGSGAAPAGASVVLNGQLVGSWGAESLLIGGLRRETAAGTVVDVRTKSLTVNNPGAEFSSPEIVLASREKLTVTAGSSVVSSGGLTQPAAALGIAGDGALIRVSGDTRASISRSALAGATTPRVSIGAGARIAGASVIVDSTYATDLDPGAVLAASALTLGSGQISVVFANASGNLTGSVVSPHLVLAGSVLQQVQQVDSLTLQSYRTIDIYGSGVFGSSSLGRLNLLAGGIRGYEAAGATAQFRAGEVLFSNPVNVDIAALPAPASSGQIRFDAGTVHFGANAFSVSGYQGVVLNASGGVRADRSGSFRTSNDLTITAPLITGAQGVAQSITANGNLSLLAGGGSPSLAGGLGASLAFQGSSILASSRIFLPSGALSLRATTGDLLVLGNLSVEGSARAFYDVVRYANAGRIDLAADAGDVRLFAGSSVSVAAHSSGGDAGILAVRAPGGVFDSDGVLAGAAGQGGVSGSFQLDAESVASFDDLTADLDAASFFEERRLRVRTGDVTVSGATRARTFSLSTDAGNITVTGLIDASGETGGRIELISRGSLVVAPTAILTVEGDRFSNAGKGGSIHLEAGAAVNGTANTAALLDLQSGSQIDLSVGEYVAGDYLTPRSSAFYGRFEGTLHLRAPRLGNDVRVDAIDSAIDGGSSIVVEAFRVYQPAGGVMNIALRNTMNADNAAFLTAGEGALGVGGMRNRLLGGTINQSRDAMLVIAPGVEIINPNGDLTLGLANTTGSASNEALAAADWDLSSYRYGSRGAPGVLTLRASGDLVFNNALSDGFTPIAQGTAQAFSDNGHSLLWLATLQSLNTNLPANTQSWSYRLSAGADLSSAHYGSVLPIGALAAGKGSVLVGEFFSAQVPNTATSGGAAAIGRDGQTADSIRISNNTTNRGTRFEVVRTGTGDIAISAGRDVQLRNPFATIYTAGVGMADRTRIFAAGDFAIPITVRTTLNHPSQGGTLGAIQQNYAAYYAMAGGNLRVSAQGDIGRFTFAGGQIVADASKQIPTNWLYRRGQIDPATGLFAVGGVTTSGVGSVNDPSASTTWWVDYSNFFQGFGALGGGDIELLAGDDIINADAAIPTNARMAGIDPLSGLNIAPAAGNLLEHGGGNLLVRAGSDIDGGSFYVERGSARLDAGGEITTNRAQSPSRGLLATGAAAAEFLDPLTWQGVTLYGGRSFFNVTARGNVLLGPATSAFFLPQGLNNKFWYKTQFQTLGETAGVSVSSFGGGVTHRLAVTLPGDTIAIPTLLAAYRQLSAVSPGSAAYYRPWLRSTETGLNNFRTIATVALPTLKSTAFGGDISVVGELNLFPSPAGELELVASGGVVGLNKTGVTRTTVEGVDIAVTAWASASINLSDADPSRVPGVMTPLGFQQVVNSRDLGSVRDDTNDPFGSVSPLFNETGAYSGVAATIDVQTALHASAPIHAKNPNPLRLYAGTGDITGLTLFSPKKTLAYAMRDITDIAFYLQHVSADDISIVSAGRDIVPFNENSPLRSLAGSIAAGNLVVDPSNDSVVLDASGLPIATQAMAGDIQIGGRGTLEVLAGRNIDLGSGANFTDGTSVGITSIGRSRNPFLPFDGADFVLMAGVGGRSGGPALGLAGSSLDFSGFASDNADGIVLGPTEEHRAIGALRRLFAVLKGTAESAAISKDYEAGYAAIESVFGTGGGSGNLLTSARDIRTTSGGTITIAVPGGGITMAPDIFGNPLTPPGIVTEYGGEVSILTDGDVDIGQARIFTLRGGDLTIWSSSGDIAAGTAPKTVVTAPPTRVLIDATSGDIQTDLGGLATGGGIGVLAAVEGVEEGGVYLIAPKGTVDAGDAGIRATGDITIAATAVVNADNIAAGGNTAGVPTAAPPPAPNIAGLSSAANSTGAANSAANQVANQPQAKPSSDEAPSIFAVEVLGYGGGDGESGGEGG